MRRALTAIVALFIFTSALAQDISNPQTDASKLTTGTLLAARIGPLGTPSSGTVTNLTGTASININGTVGATTPGTGAFTTLSASSDITANGTIKLPTSVGFATGQTLSYNSTNGFVITPTAGSANDFTIFTPTGGAVAMRLPTGTSQVSFPNGITVASTAVNFTAVATDAATTDSTACIKASDGTLLKGSGTLGICLGTSGEQFKTAFEPMKAGLKEIASLELNNYRYREGYGDSGAHIQYGPTAQGVEKVLPDLVRYNENGDAINYDWPALFFAGLKSIQELKADNDNLRACQQNWKCRIFGIGG